MNTTVPGYELHIETRRDLPPVFSTSLILVESAYRQRADMKKRFTDEQIIRLPEEWGQERGQSHFVERARKYEIGECFRDRRTLSASV